MIQETPGRATDPPPDWSVVPFAVACARCGHDLNGRTEPTCPACLLTFRWSDAVPIEQLKCTSCGYHLYGLKDPRCPECGTDFTWDEALADYHRQRKPLFEYQWRTKPVRSLFRTWWLALRPKKLWTTLEIHDPVRWRPLVASALIALVGVMILIVVLTLLFRFHNALRGTLQSANYWRARGFTLTEVMIMNLDWILIGLRSSFGVDMAAYLCLWFMSLALALLIFQQSMHRYKVRIAHIVRIACYACVIAWPGTVLGTIAGAWIHLYFPYRNNLNPIGGALVVLTLICSLRSVAIAYRDYLHMDHPWAVAAAAHLVAFMLTLVVAIPMLPQGSGAGLLQAIGETIGLF